MIFKFQELAVIDDMHVRKLSSDGTRGASRTIKAS